MKGKISVISMILVILLVIVACSNNKSEEIKSGMLTDEGGISDNAFNELAWKGLKDASREFNIQVSYKESNEEADFKPNLEELFDEGNNLIWGVGYKLSEAIYRAANLNEDIKYGIIDYSYDNNRNFPAGTPKNVISVKFRDEESSFLVGYIAGRMTETNKIGFVGGTDGQVIWTFEYGFRAGVDHAAKELGREITVTDKYADDFYDVEKSRAIARDLYRDDNDIVFHAAGGAGEGVIVAAREEDKWAIGVDMDQNYLAPDNVLTSAMKGVDRAVFNVIKDLQSGRFEGGTTIKYGLKDGGVDIAPTSDKHVPAHILREVERLKKEIIDGDIVIPNSEETYKEYLREL